MKPIERLVSFFGDQVKTAKALGVSQPAVSYWLKGTYVMSAETAFKAETLTKGEITARELLGIAESVA